MSVTTSAPPVASLPVSQAQLALWAEEQVDANLSSTGYFAVTLTTHGAGAGLTGRRLRAAAQAVLHRHPPLRSVLRHDDGALRQVVHVAADALRFTTTDVACEPGAERAAAREWAARHESRRRWDLSVEPPIRFHELRHGPGRRTIVFAVHHAGFDGRSKFLVARDFTEYLTGLVTGVPVDVEPLPHVMIPEAEPALTDEAVRYWAGELSDDREPMPLPSGRTPGVRGIRTTRTVELDIAHVTALRDLANRHEVSTFTCLVATFAQQLARYGEPAPILAVAADISDERTRAVAGVQVNVVPMLVRAGDSATPADAVREARAALGRMRRYRRVPFRSLLRGLPDDSAARLMTQCGMSFPRPPAGLALDVPGMTARWDFFTPNTSSTFERTLHIRADWPVCRIRLDYRAENLDGAGADAMLQHFTAAVASLATADATRFRPATAVAVPPDRTDARLGQDPDSELAVAAAVVAGRSHAGRDNDVVVLGAVAEEILAVETSAARMRAAKLLFAADPGEIPDTARRLVGPADIVRAAARLRRGRALDLVVPGDQLPALAHLAQDAGSAFTISAYHQWGGRVAGLLTPAPDPLEPPELELFGSYPASVRDDAGAALPANVPGTLVVTTPDGRSESTSDCAMVSATGVLRYLGPRRERLLRHRGFIDVALVDRVLHTCPQVLDAAVVRRRTRRGLTVVAVVTGHPGERAPSVAEVRAFLHDRLAGLDLPGQIEVRATMPRDRYGSIDRPAMDSR